jgi:hypothetical protein
MNTRLNTLGLLDKRTKKPQISKVLNQQKLFVIAAKIKGIFLATAETQLPKKFEENVVSLEGK